MQCPCCNFYSKFNLDRSPDLQYDDWGVLSPHRNFRVYFPLGSNSRLLRAKHRYEIEPEAVRSEICRRFQISDSDAASLVKHGLVDYYSEYYKSLSGTLTPSESMEWVRILITTCNKHKLVLGSSTIDAKLFAAIVSDAALSNYDKRQQLFLKLLPEWQPHKRFFKPAEVGAISEVHDLVPLIELVLVRNPGLQDDLKVC